MSPSCRCSLGLTRRFLLGAGVAAALPKAAHAASPSAPDEALARLMAGNRRFRDRRLTSFEADLAELRRGSAETQTPFAAVLACADSRVPVELIFDQSIGQIFVARNAGNIATPDIIASLEYGAAVLGTRVIVVLGHSNCGAVKAAIAGKAVPGQISGLFPYLLPAVEAAGPDPTATSQANARLQARLLGGASPVIGGLVAKGAIKVVAAYYDVASGIVSQLS